ncbi:MAG: SRPBCC family protein [Actinomycetota bacterium]
MNTTETTIARPVGATRAGPIHLRVERTIAAPPAVVFDLITDIDRMSDWSPEITESRWLGGAEGPEEGARFFGRNEAGSLSWTTKPTVTEVVDGRVFEFRVPMPSRSTWRYELTPIDGGTRVVELLDQTKRSPFFIRLLQKRAGITDRAADLESAMRTTLDRLAAVAERA